MIEHISGQDVKREITKTRPRGDSARALASGFVRSCMTLYISKAREITLQLDCQSEFVREYAADILKSAIGVTPLDSDSTSLSYSDCEKLLGTLRIAGGDGFEMSRLPDMTEDEQCEYIRGVFLGCGSFSARNSDGKADKKSVGGYHVEFSVLSESFADELIDLLGSRDVQFHKMSRSDKYVVYAKDIENVCNCLALMKLGRLVVELNSTAIALSIKRDVYRRINCDVANMTRTANAAVGVITDINYIADNIGLNSLPKKLFEAAQARLADPEAPISDVADALGISKSGLKHRLDSLSKIAEDARNKNNRGD